jgi:hypothetical protein
MNSADFSKNVLDRTPNTALNSESDIWGKGMGVRTWAWKREVQGKENGVRRPDGPKAGEHVSIRSLGQEKRPPTRLEKENGVQTETGAGTTAIEQSPRQGRRR